MNLVVNISGHYGVVVSIGGDVDSRHQRIVVHSVDFWVVAEDLAEGSHLRIGTGLSDLNVSMPVHEPTLT